MEYLEGIYYPYWMYSCQVSGEMQAEALRKRVTVAGEDVYKRQGIFVWYFA